MTEVLDKDVLKALSSGTRQEILKMLSRRPYTASELAKLLNKHVTTVAEHLEALKKSGLIVKKDSTNKWIYYTLAPKGDRLFKPQLYSWTLLLALSVVGIFAGVGGLVNKFFVGGVSRGFESAAQSMKIPLDNASDAPGAINAIQIDFTLVLLGALIMLGIAGIAVSLTKLRRGKSIILER